MALFGNTLSPCPECGVSREFGLGGVPIPADSVVNPGEGCRRCTDALAFDAAQRLEAPEWPKYQCPIHGDRGSIMRGAKACCEAVRRVHGPRGEGSGQ